MYLQVLRDLADARLPIVFDWSWWLAEVPQDWGTANSCLQGQKRGCRNQESSQPHLHPGNSPANSITTFCELSFSFAIGWIHFQMPYLPKYFFLTVFKLSYNCWDSTYCKLLKLYCNHQMQQAAVWKGRNSARTRQKWLKVTFPQENWTGWEEKQSTIKTSKSSLERKDLLQGRIKVCWSSTVLSQTFSSTETKYLKLFYFFAVSLNREWLWLIVFELLITSVKFLKWWVKEERCPVSVSSLT